MKILIACEFSGIVRDAFIAKGHNAMSCDLLDTERPGPHYKGDVRDVLDDGWDMMIAHPPCTDLACCGAKWMKQKRLDGRQQKAIEFFMLFINAPIPKIAVENPVGIMSTHYQKPTQIIQPYHFGHGAMKTTCLWLKGLPKLNPTNIVEREYIITPSGKKYPKWSWDTFNLPKDIRAKERSKTFPGIAAAMAAQWDSPCVSELE